MRTKKRNNYLFLFFIILSILLLFRHLYVRVSKENFSNPETFDIIILAGQSNSLGRGTRNHTPSVSDNTLSKGKISIDNPSSEIKQLTSNGRNITAATEPIVASSARGKTDPTIGHGLSFAKKYLSDNSTKKILLLGCGYSSGGSSVLATSGRRWSWDTNSDSLFYDIHTILERAIKEKKINPNSSVKVLLWDQGETDMGLILNNNRKTNYKTILNRSFRSLRSNIKGLLSSTDATFPILVTGMCVGQNYFNNERITGNGKPGAATDRIDMNRYLSTECVPYLNSNITNVKYVPTDIIGGTTFSNVLQCDSTIHRDGRIKERNNELNHFSATSQRELGERFYYYYLN